MKTLKNYLISALFTLPFLFGSCNNNNNNQSVKEQLSPPNNKESTIDFLALTEIKNHFSYDINLTSAKSKARKKIRIGDNNKEYIDVKIDNSSSVNRYSVELNKDNNLSKVTIFSSKDFNAMKETEYTFHYTKNERLLAAVDINETIIDGESGNKTFKQSIYKHISGESIFDDTVSFRLEKSKLVKLINEFENFEGRPWEYIKFVADSIKTTTFYNEKNNTYRIKSSAYGTNRKIKRTNKTDTAVVDGVEIIKKYEDNKVIKESFKAEAFGSGISRENIFSNSPNKTFIYETYIGGQPVNRTKVSNFNPVNTNILLKQYEGYTSYLDTNFDGNWDVINKFKPQEEISK